MCAFVSDVDREIRKATRFEEPNWHLLLQTLVARIDRQVVRSRKLDTLPDLPIAGLINTGCVNARTIRVPNSGDHLILVEEEIFTFLLLLSRAVAMAMPVKKAGQDKDRWLAYSTTTDEIRAHLRVRPDAVKRFGDAVLAYSITGRSSHAEPCITESQSSPFAARLNMASMSFVIAHEYLHVLAGHLKDSQHEKSSAERDDIGPTVWSMLQEAQADHEGIVLVFEALKEAGGDNLEFAIQGGRYLHLEPYLAYWGADLFLYCNEIMIKATALLRTGSEQGMHEHERYQYELLRIGREALDAGFLLKIREIYGDDNWKIASKRFHTIRDVVSELWRRTIPVIKLSHTLGVRPSASWEI